jgi:uncharacterized RDD family membrane protein YckC
MVVVDAMSWQPPSVPPSSGYAPPPGGYGPPPGSYAPPPGYPQYPAGPYGRPGPGPGLEYASFWRRFGGYILDDLIIAIPVLIIFLIIFGQTISNWANQVNAATQAGLTAPTLVLPAGGEITLALIGAAISCLYFGFLVAGWGSTLGQRAVGVRVVRVEDPTANLPLGRALARSVVWWGAGLFSFVTGVGTIVELLVFLALLWVAWDPRKQGLHDKLGRAVVVRQGLPPVTAFSPPAYPYAAPGYPTAPSYPAAPPQYPPAPPQYPAAPTQYPPTPPQYPPASQ